jgi:hypothetical protein
MDYREADLRETRLSWADVWYLDGGMTTLDNDQLRYPVSQALSQVPAEVAEQVMGGCLCIMPTAEQKGLYVPEENIRGKSIIALPETLLAMNESEINWTILHEVAHFVLNHKMLQPLEVSDRQEREANDLVRKWLESPSG